MNPLELEPFPKIARLNRPITITEKIDGTNAAVVIVEVSDFTPASLFGYPEALAAIVGGTVGEDRPYHLVFAQSRSRFIAPGKSTDNYGFAGWVQNNAEALVALLGPGTHFGEWWGQGIQRGYQVVGKRFSLFNTGRWGRSGFELSEAIPGLGVVPTLYEGPFSQRAIDHSIDELAEHGSSAAPGFMRPEGIVIYHHAQHSSFKVTLEGDEAPKGAAGHALDEERVAA